MTRFRSVLGAAAVLLSTVLVSSPARAASTFTDGGPARSVLTDGSRWLLVTGATDVTAIDTVGGRRRTIPLADGCAPRDAHRGLLLVVCPVPTPGASPGSVNATYTKPTVVRLSRGRTASVPNDVLSSVDAFGSADPGWTKIGTRWLAGEQGCYHCEDDISYVNWRTGERRSGDRSVVGDLDDPRLRPRARTRRGADLREPSVSYRGGPLEVRYRGRTVMLSTCRVDCTSVTTGADRYAWREDGILRGYVPATRQRARWRLPAAALPPARYSNEPRLTRTRIAIFTGTRTTDGTAVEGRVMTAAWPRKKRVKRPARPVRPDASR